MLSLARCREILGTRCPLSDEEVKDLRDQLYEVAEVALDALRRGNPPEVSAGAAPNAHRGAEQP